MWNFFAKSHGKNVAEGTVDVTKKTVWRNLNVGKMSRSTSNGYGSATSLLISNVHVKCILIEEIMNTSTIFHQYWKKYPPSN